jgi:GT2 family glycosyltransferase
MPISNLIGEVVIVDGNSVDNTLKIVSEFSMKLPLVILSDEGRGLGYARDVGWRATSSPYIIMLDSDVIMEPQFVTESLRIMENDERVGALSAKLRPKTEEKGWFALFQVKNLAINLHLSEPTYPQPAVALHTGCTMFRREALERVGGFDHYFRLAKEDSDISFRLRKAGYLLSYLPIEVTHLERARFWKTNFRYGRSYVHISKKHPDMSPLLTFKNAFLTASLIFPPLQLLVYLHYVRRYGEVQGLSFTERLVLPGFEVLRQAVRTAGMLYELLNR